MLGNHNEANSISKIVTGKTQLIDKIIKCLKIKVITPLIIKHFNNLGLLYKCKRYSIRLLKIGFCVLYTKLYLNKINVNQFDINNTNIRHVLLNV